MKAATYMSTGFYKNILESAGEEKEYEKELVSLYLCKTHQGPKVTIYQSSRLSWICSPDTEVVLAWV